MPTNTDEGKLYCFQYAAERHTIPAPPTLGPWVSPFPSIALGNIMWPTMVCVGEGRGVCMVTRGIPHWLRSCGTWPKGR